MDRPQTFVDHLRALLRATACLGPAVSDGDWERVLALLEERQASMDGIDALPAASLLGVDFDLASRLLGEIMRLDEEVAPRVQASLEAIREAISESALARTTIGAYRKSTYTSAQVTASRFVDRQR